MALATTLTRPANLSLEPEHPQGTSFTLVGSGTPGSRLAHGSTLGAVPAGVLGRGSADATVAQEPLCFLPGDQDCGAGPLSLGRESRSSATRGRGLFRF